MSSEIPLTPSSTDRKAGRLLRKRSKIMSNERNKDRRLLRAAPNTTSEHDIEHGDDQSTYSDDEYIEGRGVHWSLTSSGSKEDIPMKLNEHNSYHDHGSDDEFENTLNINKGNSAMNTATYEYVPTKNSYRKSYHCMWLNKCLTTMGVIAVLCGVALAGYIAGRYVTLNEQATSSDTDQTVASIPDSMDISPDNTFGPKAPLQVDTTGMTRIQQMYYSVGHLSDPNFLSHNFTMARTPQELALEWLATLDPNVLPVDDPQMAERYGLLVMYYSLNGDSWSDGTNWLIQKDICTWSGVSCEIRSVTHNDPPKNVVTSLDLSSRQLQGFIPNEIAALVHLEHVALHNNPGLNQELPQWIGHLTNLKSLQIYDTGLSGTIPSTIGRMSSLQELYLHRNALQGVIPNEITQLTNLQELLLYKNKLAGSVPVGIGQLTQLKRLWLSDNDLIGQLPAGMGSMISLRALYVDHNQLNGTLPGFLANAKDLNDIRLHNNTFVGEIPEEWISLRNLYILYLDHNELSGTIPEWMGSYSNLQFLQLDHNQFTGLIPNGLSRTTSLKVLNLSSNQLNGGIPQGLGMLSKLEALMLHENNLEGNIPSSLSSLKHLKKLNLSQNPKIVGSVPSEICALSIEEVQVDCSVACTCCIECYQETPNIEKNDVVQVNLGRSHNAGH